MNWKRFFVVAFALLVVLSIGSGRLAAQTNNTGDVAGVVTDQSSAVVPDAKVTLKDGRVFSSLGTVDAPRPAVDLGARPASLQGFCQRPLRLGRVGP